MELVPSLLQDDDRTHLLKLAGSRCIRPNLPDTSTPRNFQLEIEIHAAEYCLRECERIWNDQCELLAVVFVDNMPESMSCLVEIIYTENNSKVSSLESKVVALFTGKTHGIKRRKESKRQASVNVKRMMTLRMMSVDCGIVGIDVRSFTASWCVSRVSADLHARGN